MCQGEPDLWSRVVDLDLEEGGDLGLGFDEREEEGGISLGLDVGERGREEGADS